MMKHISGTVSITNPACGSTENSLKNKKSAVEGDDAKETEGKDTVILGEITSDQALHNFPLA